jgi:hypothetical protein
MTHARDGLQIAGTLGGGEGVTRIHNPTLTRVTGQWAELQPRDGVQEPLIRVRGKSSQGCYSVKQTVAW